MSLKDSVVLRGADPELFLIDAQGMPQTSIGLIGGSKHNPRSLGGGYALQEDNVAVEFNIPPADNIKAFSSSIQYVLTLLRQELGAQNLGLHIVPTADFTKEQLQHPQAQELGCEPDYNAWTYGTNPRPIAPETLRSSGGHLHLGWIDPTYVEQIDVVRAHDLFCGVPSILYDKDTRRRSIYGKAGAHRIKDYGVEYRTLSNFWIQSEELSNLVYTQSEKAINFVREDKVIDEEDIPLILQCINESNEAIVHHLNAKYNIL